MRGTDTMLGLTLPSLIIGTFQCWPRCQARCPVHSDLGLSDPEESTDYDNSTSCNPSFLHDDHPGKGVLVVVVSNTEGQK